MDPLEHGHTIGLVACALGLLVLVLFYGFKLAELVEERGNR